MRQCRYFAALLCLIAVVATNLQRTPAQAISGGTVDSSGSYPSVGFVLSYASGGAASGCSGTLISANVVLTAGHCTYNVNGLTIVSFNADIANSFPDASMLIPQASDPFAGYTRSDSLPAGWHRGTAITHPEYSDFTDMDNWNDVGLIILDQAVTEIEPQRLAPVGYLEGDAYRKPNHTPITIIGFGTAAQTTDDKSQKTELMTYPIARRFTDVVGQKLMPQVLQVNGNFHDARAGGGSCYGDSGGPGYLNGYLVAVISYSNTAKCRYLSGLQRLDVPAVHNWIFGVEGVDRVGASVSG